MGRLLSLSFPKTTLRISTLVLMLADIAALLVSIAVSLFLRFDDLSWPLIYDGYLRSHLPSLPIVLALYLVIFHAFGLHSYAWRFASLEMLWAVLYANTAGVLILIVTQFIVDGQPFPRSVIVMFWVSSVILVGAARILLRIFSIVRHDAEASAQAAPRGMPPKRVVILGAGPGSVSVLNAMRDDTGYSYKPVGFLDDDPRQKGIIIHKVKVLGPIKLVEQFVDEHTVDEVIVALPETNSAEVRGHILHCRKHRIPVKVVPNLQDMLTGNGSLQLADFGVEDLLRRPAADTDIPGLGAYLTGKRVLVTGAGGSIGSELCRQILSCSPENLVLLGHGENSIHRVLTSLLREYPDCADRLCCTIASVSNESRIRQEILAHRPEIVFHAAAHKHVPVMEANVQEAVQNNVLGTTYLAHACGQAGVKRFVLISTDKAAAPCSVMGATKWLCEEIVRTQAVKWRDTAFIAVRFGNVLGSRGSVVPIFREQISHGGPVTVTHPEMTRYFMTIPEAVRLVLQAGGVGRSGELYLLDMGNPMKIGELAEDMIRLCGMEPGVDIQIEYTGVRPGERLHEQLVSHCEFIRKTAWQGLLLVDRPTHFSPQGITEAVGLLERSVRCGRPADVRRLLDDLVQHRTYPDRSHHNLSHSHSLTRRRATMSPRRRR